MQKNKDVENSKKKEIDLHILVKKYKRCQFHMIEGCHDGGFNVGVGQTSENRWQYRKL